jgi:two-component system LytT family response regulator
MRVLIVDDEPLARRGLALRLKRFSDLEVVGECEDGASAVQQILDLVPDLVLLDVQMPGLDGFEVLNALPKDKMPQVIFVTAYDEHAIRAFEVHAVDYLLKPVTEERLAAAIDHAEKSMRGVSAQRSANLISKLLEDQRPKYLARFISKTGSRICIVQQEQVLWIAAAGDYAELHTRNSVHLIRETMDTLAQNLDPGQFIRVHRSTIVRLNQILELQIRDNGEFDVRLRDGSQHRCSRTYAKSIESWLRSKPTGLQ